MTGQPVKITGGFSSPNSVGIASAQYTSVATSHEDGAFIIVEVTPASSVLRKTREGSMRYLPRTFRFFLVVWGNAGRAGKALITAVLAMNFLMMTAHTSTTSVGDSARTLLLLFFPYFTYFYIFVGKWHAAEHQTIAAYDQIGSFALEDISRQDRVHDSCGSRFMIPIVCACLLGRAFPSPIGKLVSLLAVEAVLWVDAWWGLYNVPVLTPLSRAMQRYLLTRKPDTLQLKVAQAALNRLIHVHQQEDQVAKPHSVEDEEGQSSVQDTASFTAQS